MWGLKLLQPCPLGTRLVLGTGQSYPVSLSPLSVAQILTIWFSRNLLGEMYWDMTVPKGPVGFGVGQAVFLRVVQMSRLLCNYGQD